MGMISNPRAAGGGVSASEVNVGRGTTAARPAAGTEGRMYFNTTLGKLQRDNGSSWQDVDPYTVYQTWGTARPTSPYPGLKIRYTDVSYEEEYTGSAWVPGKDKWGLYDFIQAGELDLTMPISSGATGEQSFPSVSSSSLPSGATTSTPANEGIMEIDNAATGGQDGIVLWNLPSESDKVLCIINGFQNNDAIPSRFAIQKTIPAAGQALDEAYWGLIYDGSRPLIQKETGGSVSTVVTSNINFETPTTYSNYRPDQQALFVDGANNIQSFWVRHNNGSWVKLCGGTDESITTFFAVGCSFRNIDANIWVHAFGGLVTFAKAA